MFWRLGSLINSLTYQVNKAFEDSLLNNEAYKKNRPSSIERLLTYCSQRHILTTLAMLSVSAILFFITSHYMTAFLALFPSSLDKLNRFIEFQPAILGTQVTLLGVIYPLVIAFIGILIQGRSANEALWTIYRHYSGFMLIGFSALALILVFILIKLLEPWLDHSQIFALSLSTSFWFVINLVLTGRFLKATIDFVSSKSRMIMVTRYAIYVILTQKYKSMLKKEFKNDYYDIPDNDFPFNSNKKQQNTLNINQIMDALFSQVEDAITADNSIAFDAALTNLVNLQKNIESVIHLIEQKINDGYDFLSDNIIILKKDFIKLPNRNTYYISIIVIRNITNNKFYFERCCSVYRKLYTNKIIMASKEIAIEYIQSHFAIWGNLMSYITSNSYNASMVLALPEKRAIKYFITSWEEWQHKILPNKEILTDREFPLLMEHLTLTSKVVINACTYNNHYASEWATDALLHWIDLFTDINYLSAYFDEIPQAITVYNIHPDSDNKLFTKITSGHDITDSKIKIKALENLWMDMRILTAAFIVTGISKYNDSQLVHYTVIIKALINGQYLKPTGPLNSHTIKEIKISDLLEIYLRQTGCWQYQEIYKEYLNKEVRNFENLGESDNLPSRIYSWSGLHYDRYLISFFKIIGIGLTEKNFKLDQQWQSFLTSEHVADSELNDTIRSLEELSKPNKIIQSVTCQLFDINAEEYAEKSNHFLDSITNIANQLKDKLHQEIRDTPIDQKVLTSMAKQLSDKIFKTDRLMPISLFKEMECVDNVRNTLIKIPVQNIRKEDISHYRNKYLEIFYNPIFRNHFSSIAKQSFFSQLIEKGNWKESYFDNAKGLIIQAVEQGKALHTKGLHPIMFTSAYEINRLITINQYEYLNQKDKLPFKFSEQKLEIGGYIGHIEHIEVHSLPDKYKELSLLTCKEAFKQVNIKRFADDRFIDAQFDLENSQNITGTLTFSFGFDCEFLLQDSSSENLYYKFTLNS